MIAVFAVIIASLSEKIFYYKICYKNVMDTKSKFCKRNCEQTIHDTRKDLRFC